jgi:23S rRNA (cytidine2498-2'-O)-methyltransferase
LDQLRAAIAFAREYRRRRWESSPPGTYDAALPRDESYYLPRFGREQPLLAIAEDDAGIRAIALGSIEGEAVFVADYVPGEIGNPSLRAALLEHVARGADALRLPSMYVAASSEAEEYEEIGCSPKLHLQFSGAARLERRGQLIRGVRGDHRVLARGSFGPDIVNVQLAVDRVDHALVAELALRWGAENATFIMSRWAGPDCDRLPDGTVRYRRPRYIVAFHPRFARNALREVREVDPGAVDEQRPSPESTVVPMQTAGRDLAPAFEAEAPVFVRHLAPVQVVVPLEGTPQDLDRIVDVLPQVRPLDPAKTFAVQCRKGPSTKSGRHDETSYTNRDVEIRVGVSLAGRGHVVELERPEQVVSIYLDGGVAYVGASDTSLNVARHADEHRRRAALPTRISRAEHKLLEAIEVFDVTLVPGTRALDLGAAPGGWSYVLAEHGLHVVAVDPADLAPAALQHPLVSHIRGRAEMLEPAGVPFDLVVNDMALDPDESAAIMCGVAGQVRRGAVGVMTIKLPTLNVPRWLSATVHVLEQAWEVESIRHLFHNRQEVTALLRRLV